MHKVYTRQYENRYRGVRFFFFFFNHSADANCIVIRYTLRHFVHGRWVRARKTGTNCRYVGGYEFFNDVRRFERN